MTALSKLFEYEGQTVRVWGTPDEPLFCALDVCKALSLQNHNDALSKGIPEDEKGVASNLTGGVEQIYPPGKVVVLKEPGLYRLIFRSDKPKAEAFRRWVFHEVLPSIRKTGGYTVGGLDLKDAFAKAKSGRAQTEIIAFMRELHAGQGRSPAQTGFRPILPIEETDFWQSLLQCFQAGYLTSDNIRADRYGHNHPDAYEQVYFVPAAVCECLRRFDGQKWPDLTVTDLRVRLSQWPSWVKYPHRQWLGGKTRACWGFRVAPGTALAELARAVTTAK